MKGRKMRQIIIHNARDPGDTVKPGTPKTKTPGRYIGPAWERPTQGTGCMYYYEYELVMTLDR